MPRKSNKETEQKDNHSQLGINFKTSDLMITCLKFSPVAPYNILFVSYNTGKIKIVSENGGERYFSEKEGSGVNDFDISSSGRKLASATEEGRLLLYDVETEKLLEKRKLQSEDGPCMGVSITPQENLMCVSTYEGTISMFDYRSHRLIRRINPAHDGLITQIENHPDGTVCVSSG